MCPLQIDGHFLSVAVAYPLRNFSSDQEPDVFQILARGFDAAKAYPEHLRDPGSLAESLGPALSLTVVETAEEMSQDGGDDGPLTATGDEAKQAPRHGYTPMAVGDFFQHGLDARKIPARQWFCRERDRSCLPRQ